MSEEQLVTALKRMPYGFYSITSRSENDVNAMVANWVTQASFSPRLVAMGLAKKAHSFGIIKDGGVFAVNIFNREDHEAIRPFCGSRAKRPEKMTNANYTPGPETGCPILQGAAAYVECKVVDMIDVGGDHVILVGEAINGGVIKEGEVSDTLTLQDMGWSYSG